MFDQRSHVLFWPWLLYALFFLIVCIMICHDYHQHFKTHLIEPVALDTSCVVGFQRKLKVWRRLEEQIWEPKLIERYDGGLSYAEALAGSSKDAHEMIRSNTISLCDHIKKVTHGEVDISHTSFANIQVWEYPVRQADDSTVAVAKVLPYWLMTSNVSLQYYQVQNCQDTDKSRRNVWHDMKPWFHTMLRFAFMQSWAVFGTIALHGLPMLIASQVCFQKCIRTLLPLRWFQAYIVLSCLAWTALYGVLLFKSYDAVPYMHTGPLLYKVWMHMSQQQFGYIVADSTKEYKTTLSNMTYLRSFLGPGLIVVWGTTVVLYVVLQQKISLCAAKQSLLAPTSARSATFTGQFPPAAAHEAGAGNALGASSAAAAGASSAAAAGVQEISAQTDSGKSIDEMTPLLGSSQDDGSGMQKAKGQKRVRFASDLQVTATFLPATNGSAAERTGTQVASRAGAGVSLEQNPDSNTAMRPICNISVGTAASRVARSSEHGLSLPGNLQGSESGRTPEVFSEMERSARNAPRSEAGRSFAQSARWGVDDSLEDVRADQLLNTPPDENTRLASDWASTHDSDETDVESAPKSRKSGQDGRSQIRTQRRKRAYASGGTTGNPSTQPTRVPRADQQEQYVGSGRGASPLPRSSRGEGRSKSREKQRSPSVSFKRSLERSKSESFTEGLGSCSPKTPTQKHLLGLSGQTNGGSEADCLGTVASNCYADDNRGNHRMDGGASAIDRASGRQLGLQASGAATIDRASGRQLGLQASGAATSDRASGRQLGLQASGAAIRYSGGGGGRQPNMQASGAAAPLLLRSGADDDMEEGQHWLIRD